MDFLTRVDPKVLLVGVTIAACCSLLSTFVVLRRMSMIAEGVAHAGYGGFGVALILGYFFSFDYGTLTERIITGTFCLATALGIGYVTRSKKVHDDSAIGIFLVATMALGYLLTQIRVTAFPGAGLRPPKTESLLFGDFIAVNWNDALVAGVTAAICFIAVALFYHQLLYTTLDEEMARVNGVPTRWINTLLLVLVTLVIAVGARMIGVLMITAMMIIPGATGAMLSRRFGGVLAASIGVGVGGTFLALVLEYNTVLANFAPGPVLVLMLFVIFAVVWTIRHFFKPKVAELADDAPARGHDHHGHSH